ncbi:MAG: response regulator [Thermoanaerobaculia bacterium]|nr:response regulator [Thermoanaerobaculia bacterium]
MPRTEKPHVLLVDDNEAVCTLIMALLGREFEVDCVLDGADAIERLKTNSYAAILLDLRMPQVDGFGVLDFLVANNPEIIPRVLVVTASLTKNETDRVRTYPVCGIIAKPFEVETLLHAVRDCTGPSGESALGGFVTSGVLILLAQILRRGL